MALSIGGTIAERPLEARSPLPARTFEYDPFVDIFSRLDEPTDLPLFTATISGEDAATTYFVFGRLTVFDGEGFNPGLGDEATFGDGPSITQDVVIDRLGGDWLPSVSGTIAASTGEIDGGNLVGEPDGGAALRRPVDRAGDSRRSRRGRGGTTARDHPCYGRR